MAIYPSLALLNHSCDPNIVKFYRGSHVVGIAIRNICKGEEICENYYPCYTLVPREQRQAWLKKHYCFECLCLACVKKYDLLESLEKQSMINFPWRCQSCQAELSNGKCQQCRNLANLQDLQAKFLTSKNIILDCMKTCAEANTMDQK